MKFPPDALDLLTIWWKQDWASMLRCRKVAEKWDNELSPGFNRTVQRCSWVAAAGSAAEYGE